MPLSPLDRYKKFNRSPAKTTGYCLLLFFLITEKLCCMVTPQNFRAVKNNCCHNCSCKRIKTKHKNKNKVSKTLTSSTYGLFTFQQVVVLEIGFSAPSFILRNKHTLVFSSTSFPNEKLTFTDVFMFTESEVCDSY